MRRPGRKPLKFGLLFVLVATVALSAAAFTAANTVPATNAGDGSTAVSGYTISNVNYTLAGSNPQQLGGVTFTISPVNVDAVQVRVISTGAFYPCTDDNSGNVTCTFTTPLPTVANADELTVVAAD